MPLTLACWGYLASLEVISTVHSGQVWQCIQQQRPVWQHIPKRVSKNASNQRQIRIRHVLNLLLQLVALTYEGIHPVQHQHDPRCHCSWGSH